MGTYLVTMKITSNGTFFFNSFAIQLKSSLEEKFQKRGIDDREYYRWIVGVADQKNKILNLLNVVKRNKTRAPHLLPVPPPPSTEYPSGPQFPS